MAEQKKKSTLKDLYRKLMGTDKPSPFSISDTKGTIDKRNKRMREVLKD